MRKLVTSNAAMIALAMAVLALSVYIDVIAREINYLQRAGAPIALIGIITAVRPLIRSGIDGSVHDRTFIGGGGANDAPFVEAARQARRDVRGEVIGLILAIVGTILGSYADAMLSGIVN